MYRSFLAWMPILFLLALQCIPAAHWCTPINPGGRELACGYEYAEKAVRFTVDLMQIFGACAFIATGWHAVQRRLSVLGLCGFALSIVLVGLMIFLKVRYGVDDSP